MPDILQNCYRLPWTKEDNPNGWIEPTTYCQLRCPGCYRGVDQENHLPLHVELSLLIKQIDWLIEKRNIQTLSIAGGDPLLYPQLNELVTYASGKGLRTMIYTNGIALDENYIKELRDCGAVQIVIHIDRFQKRKNKQMTDKDVEDLKYHFCELFRKVKGINLGFIQPLSKDCLSRLESMNRFFTANRDIVNLVVYTLYREICWSHNKKPAINTQITIEEVIQNMVSTGYFLPAAYLPGVINTNQPAWMFSFSIGSKKSISGFLNGKLYSVLQRRYYENNHRHLFITRKSTVELASLFKLAWYRCIRRILINIFKEKIIPGNKFYFQTCLILRGPIKTFSEWDLCNGCPDAMLINSDLVPSCLLNEKDFVTSSDN